MILELAQWLPKDIVEPKKKFPEVCHISYYKKKQAFFLIEKSAVFLKVVSIDLLGPKEMSL